MTVLAALRSGVERADKLSQQTGLALPVIREVKRRALADGLLTPPELKPKRLSEEERAAIYAKRAKQKLRRQSRAIWHSSGSWDR
jgi:hypothetical protein